MGRWTRGRSASGGYADHCYVRGALGQLLGYAAHCAQPIQRLTALFPMTASGRRYPLLNTYGIGAFIPEAVIRWGMTRFRPPGIESR